MQNGKLSEKKKRKYVLKVKCLKKKVNEKKKSIKSSA